MQRPDRYLLAPDLDISRIVTGLWQVADMERGGIPLDPEMASQAMLDYAKAGFDTFDMADHYGSAEIIAGRFLERARNGELPAAQKPHAFTKWCPAPGPMNYEVVRAGVERSLIRMKVDCIDLMQFHWWTFEHPSYLDAVKALVRLQREGLIRHIGLTNFDSAHLRLLVRHGLRIVSNQVSFSLLDRRAAGELSDFCMQNDVRLLAYGTLCGGFMSEQWLGRPEPGDIGDWSKMKYKRFIDAIGGWCKLQAILGALHEIATRHQVSLPNVASRWVLEHPAVAAVIVGARLGEREHRQDNLELFSFKLDATDLQALDHVLADTRPLSGDCGDEYRRPPFLTASGDLTHHLQSMPQAFKGAPSPSRPNRLCVSSGSVWEPICGYSRAIRVGNRVLVSGTTATNGSGEVVCPGDAAGQAVFILDKIAASLAAAGASLADVVVTRVYLKNADEWEPVSRVHGKYFGEIRPANVLLEVARLIGDYLVEIEAEAVVSE